MPLLPGLFCCTSTSFALAAGRGLAYAPIMPTTVAALLPVFLLIVLGHVLRRTQFLPDGFWPPAEKLTYYVTFPALLVTNLAGADFADLPAAPLAGVVAGATLINAALAVGLGRFVTKSGPTRTSFFQGVMRPNTYFGLAAAAALYGEVGVTLTAVCIAAVVPLVNLLSVTAMVAWAGRAAPGVWGLLRPILTNPLILACAAGIGLNLLGLGLPAGIDSTLDILGRAALPIGLLAVGAGLNLDALLAGRRAVFTSAAMKMGLLPLLAAAGAALAGFPATAAGVAVLYASLPCSPSAYVLSRQMGGDATLMAGIITAHTLMAALIVPINLAVYT